MSVKKMSGRVSAQGEAPAGARWTPTVLVKISAARWASPRGRRSEWDRTAGCRFGLGDGRCGFRNSGLRTSA